MVSSCGYPDMKQGTYLLSQGTGIGPYEGLVASDSYITLSKDVSKSQIGIFSDGEGNLLSFHGLFLENYDFSIASWTVRKESRGADFVFSDDVPFADGFHSLSIDFSTEKGMSFLSLIGINIVKNGGTNLMRVSYSVDNSPERNSSSNGAK